MTTIGGAPSQSRFVLALDATALSAEAVLAACCVATAAIPQSLDTESVHINPFKWHGTGWTIVLCSAVGLPADVCFAGAPEGTASPATQEPGSLRYRVQPVIS